MELDLDVICSARDGTYATATANPHEEGMVVGSKVGLESTVVDKDTLRRYRFSPPSVHEKKRLMAVLYGPDPLRVLIRKYNVEINKEKLECLLPMGWFNDEVTFFSHPTNA
jgi:hypothetical protein